MALPKLNKLNIVDLAVITIVVLFVTSGGIYYMHKPAAESSKLFVTVEISDKALISNISAPAAADENVYLNNLDIPVNTVKVSDNAGNLDITLEGAGHIDSSGDIFFNGQRILIGQKAEIHASYFAQGKIVKVENAN